MWNSLGHNAAQVQTLAAGAVVVLSVLIYLVYRRQAKIMEGQAETAREQNRVNELLATASLAPVVVPEATRYCAYPDNWPAHRTRSPVNDSSRIGVCLRNVGRAPAFDLRVTAWRVGPDGPASRQDWLEASTRFLGRGEAAVLTVTADTPEGRGVLVTHCQDFTGQAWHTTWNLSPKSGEYEESDCPVVWNPRKWADTSGVQGFCPHCNKAGG